MAYRGWVAAGQLVVGDRIRRVDGRYAALTAVRLVVRPEVMYNLTVADAHTFFVGADGWLVHNCPVGGNSATINPFDVRFSQADVGYKFKNGGTIDDMASGLRAGSIDPNSVPPIRLVERNGSLFTLDNRRLEAFRRADMDIPYRMATDAEARRETWKFTTRNHGVSVRVRGE